MVSNSSQVGNVQLLHPVIKSTYGECLSALKSGEADVYVFACGPWLGKLFPEVMAREQLTHHELNAALRAAGCSCVEEVHYAILENNGQITIQPRKQTTQ